MTIQYIDVKQCFNIDGIRFALLYAISANVINNDENQ